jgi:integrase
MEYRVEAHRRRWRVRWREGGALQRRSFDTKPEADAFAAALGEERTAVREAAVGRSGPLTVSAIVAEYLRRRRSRLQASTQYHYEQLIRRHIEPAIGPLNARLLADDPSPVQDFYDALPPTTALHVHQILRPAFQYAVDHKKLERNPCSVARPPRKRRPEKLIPTSDDVVKIVQAARDKDPRFGLLVWLVSRLALRRGEACALRWEDFRPERLEVRVRRTIARKARGTYIKVPKSGEARTLRMDPRFFEKLDASREEEGWLFPRAYNCPHGDETGITPQSTAGRLLKTLDDLGGSLASPTGSAGVEVARLLKLGKNSALPMVRQLVREGLIARAGNRSRTYELSLTEAGRGEMARWTDRHDRGLPWFPNTVDAKFTELMRELDMPYTLHSLRHFVATHLYNKNRDWVQLARFLGHTNPAITMSLYANHVIDASQLALGEAAMELYDDPEIDPDPDEGPE